MADDVVILRTELESADTVRKLEELARRTTAFRKSQIKDTKEYVQAATLENQVLNEKNRLNQMAYSSNAKLKESYFSLGQELRTMYREQRLANRTVNEMAGLLSLAGGKATQAVNTFQGVNFALDGLAISAKAAGFGIASLMGPLSLLISAGAGLYVWMTASGAQVKDTGKAAEEAARFLKEYQEAGAAAGRLAYQSMSPEARLARVKARRGAIARERQPVSLPSILGTPSGMAAAMRGPSMSPFLGKEDLELAKEQADLEKEIETNRKKGFEDAQRMFNALQTADKETLRLFGALLGVADPELRGHFPYSWERGTGLGRLNPVGAPGIRGLQPGDWENFGKRGEQTMKMIESGAMEAGRAIVNYIVGPLGKGLDEGERLALTLLAIAAQVAITAATGNPALGSMVSSFIPHARGGMLYEPVVGVGLQSGRVHSFAEQGPEYISPAREARRYGGGGGGPMVFIADTRVKGRDLVISYKLNEPLYRRGTLT